MYDNVGRELKKWAEFIVHVQTIPSACLGGFLFVSIAVESEKLLLGLLVGALVTTIGYLLARLSAIMLYAFGELVETNASTAKSAEELVKLMKGDVGNTVKTASTKSAVQTAKYEGQKTGVWNPNAFSHYKDNG